MIRYHGGPITPIDAALACWRGAHAMISFAWPDQLPIAAEVTHSFALDNGAFTAWKSGNPVSEWSPYLEWVQKWRFHPGFDWALIPDVIEGNEWDNDDLIGWWISNFGNRPSVTRSLSVPIWHLHESITRLAELVSNWPRVAIGSSGEYADIGTTRWWSRISEAMEIACNKDGHPKAKLHGLRQMDPTIFSHIPYSSVDSTSVARNIGIDVKWSGPYQPLTKESRALVLRDRIEVHATAARWSGSAGVQANLELIG